MNPDSPRPALDFPPSERARGESGIGHPVLFRDAAVLKSPAAKIKASSAWQDRLWQNWPRDECWPAKMDVYEAAAYLRVSPDTIRRALVVARDGKARLAHQRLGSIYRIRKIDLDSFGVIAGRDGGL
jgi:excisionase family DNA binding protein